jgi:hypothetical protein
MSDPNEPRDAAQQGAGPAQDDTESRAEATEAAERRAQELGVDLTSVEGSGPGGRVTARDVENAQRPSDTTARSTETLERDVSTSSTESVPTRDDIHMQYVVLKATLAGPKDGPVDLKFINEDGDEDPITPNTFPDNPRNFFAPRPRIVQWVLPRPQRPVPARLPGTNQRCRREECLLLRDTDSPIE